MTTETIIRRAPTFRQIDAARRWAALPGARRWVITDAARFYVVRPVDAERLCRVAGFRFA